MIEVPLELDKNTVLGNLALPPKRGKSRALKAGRGRGCGGKAPRPRVGGGRDAGGGLAVWKVFGFGRVTVALLREGMGLWIGGGSAACKRIC